VAINTCNTHRVDFPNVFNTTNSGTTSGTFVANLGNAGGPTTKQCTGTSALYDICANVNITFLVEETATTVTSGNQTFSVRQDSLLGTVTVTNWNFASIATGLRLKLKSSVDSTNIKAYVVNPGDSSNAVTPQLSVDTITLVDALSRQAGIAFSSYGLLNGNPISVNVTGPYPDPLSIPEIYVDVMKTSLSKTDTITFFFNIYFPTLDGNSADVVSSSIRLEAFFSVVFFVVFLF